MCYFKKVALALVCFLLLSSILYSDIALSLTIKEEETIAQEFMKQIRKWVKLIDDKFVVDYINKVGNKVAEKIENKPFSFKFYLIDNSEYNAFAGPGGHIFIHSGLFKAMDTEEELAGILAHEIAHVVCRHISERLSKNAQIQTATLAGLALAILLGSTGNDEAMTAVTQSSVAIGKAFALAYSREDEREADQLGLQFLDGAGYTGAGLIDSLKKIREKQWLTPEEMPTYLSTHPGTDERIVYLSAAIYEKKREKNVGYENQPKEFKMARTRVTAFYGDKDTAKQKLGSYLEKYDSDTIANYGYALILARENRYEEALKYFTYALSENPFDLQILKDYGLSLFNAGEYKKSVEVMDSVFEMTDDAELLFYLGRAKLLLNRPHEAESIFKLLTDKEPKKFELGFYYLAKACAGVGKYGDSHYYLGIYYIDKHDSVNAKFHLKKALSLCTDPEKKKKIEKALSGII